MSSNGRAQEAALELRRPTPARRAIHPLWALAASVAFVALLLLIGVSLGLHERLVELLAWVDAQGAWAALLFIGLMTAVVIFLLPGIFFTTGAGFVFGIVEGTVYVVLGTTLGAALAFLIARHLFGARARAWLLGRAKLQVVTEEMARHDFQVVLLTRLIPFFPGKLSNYFYGLTPFRFGRYALASLIGFIPFSLHNVYLGSLAADLASLAQGQIARSPLQWAVYGLGFAVTVTALWWFNRLARDALRRYGMDLNAQQEA